MDVLAGQIPISSRIGPSKPGDRRDPPSWDVGTDPASRRRRGVRAVFGRLHPRRDRRMAQGLCRRRHPVHPVICRPDVHQERHHQSQLRTNHRTARWHGRAGDGADRACRRTTTASRTNPKLEIFLAAGNSYLTDGHVVFTGDNQQPPTSNGPGAFLPTIPCCASRRYG